MRPLRVLMASTSYPKNETDWRGIFIRNMTWALARNKDISLRAWCPPGTLPHNVAPAATFDDARWLQKLADSGGIAHTIKSGNPRGILRAAQLMRRLGSLYRRETHVDLVHANWIQLALPMPRDGKPLLATVLGTDFKLLRIPGMIAALRWQMRQRHVAICPNADWMVPDLQRHFGDLALVKCVPFGIHDAYYDLQRRPARPHRWLSVTRVTESKIGDLFRWGDSSFRNGARELHLFGPMQESIALPDWVVYHGPVSQSDLLETWFPSAAGLITLSRHSEGRPQVMIEAMAAGLPIVASDLEAHLELTERNQAGVICRSAVELAAALQAMESEAGVEAGRQGRATAAALFGTWDDCARRYVEIYSQISSK